jgi:hypothetical protein
MHEMGGVTGGRATRIPSPPTSVTWRAFIAREFRAATNISTMKNVKASTYESSVV